MTSTLHLKSVAWIVMKVLKEKDKEGLSLQKNTARKSDLSQDSTATSCKQLHGNTSLEADHLFALPSTWGRPRLICLELLTHEIIDYSSGLFFWREHLHLSLFRWLGMAPLHRNKKQLLLCRPLGGETFKKSPSSSVATTEIVLWITWASITLTLK